MVLDERGSGIHRQRGFVCLYHCLCHHLLFPFCNASGCGVYELRIADYGRSVALCSGILVHQAEGLCWTEGGGSGYCDSCEGCSLRWSDYLQWRTAFSVLAGITVPLPASQLEG